jgi:methionyl-tRNA formyltransferase
VLETLKAQNSALVDEALEYLHRAVENRPNYDNAMAYLNLVYRRKADVDWNNEAAREDDLVQAENWRSKAMYTRKANEEKTNAAPVSVRQ